MANAQKMIQQRKAQLQVGSWFHKVAKHSKQDNGYYFDTCNNFTYEHKM